MSDLAPVVSSTAASLEEDDKHWQVGSSLCDQACGWGQPDTRSLTAHLGWGSGARASHDCEGGVGRTEAVF